MRNQLHCLKKTVSTVLAVAAWLLAVQIALAGGVKSGGDSAYRQFQQKTGSPFDVPADRLEERLFSDAADGRFGEFSTLEAALVAGGTSDAESLNRYRKKAEELAGRLRQTVDPDGDPRELAEAVFDFMHRQVLVGGYDLAYTDLRRVLDEGRYNCLSATVLFNYLAGEIGLDCRTMEMPGHAMSRVAMRDERLDIETTCPNWFQLKGDSDRHTAVSKVAGASAASDRTKAREVSAIQLSAMIYYNRGVDFLGEKLFAEAAAANAKALRLDPENGVARSNLLATLNNWSIDLGNAGKFEEAINTLRCGLAMDPKFAAFSQNYVHLHRQWVDQLCRERRFEEALDILGRAMTEMPNRDGLKRVESDVRQRWAKVEAGK